MAKRIRLFSSGDEYRHWLGRNCSRCPKDTATPICDLSMAISLANLEDGTVSGEHAARLGATPEALASLGWPCLEREVAP